MHNNSSNNQTNTLEPSSGCESLSTTTGSTGNNTDFVGANRQHHLILMSQLNEQNLHKIDYLKSYLIKSNNSNNQLSQNHYYETLSKRMCGNNYLNQEKSQNIYNEYFKMDAAHNMQNTAAPTTVYNVQLVAAALVKLFES